MKTTELKNKKIFVIDDEEDLRDVMEFQFQARGHQVRTAVDGVDALERLESVNPDLIILDLNMPRMGGIEFYQKICDANGCPKYPILVLTARANTRQLFLDFDVEGFITKPFEIDEVIDQAELIMQKSRKLTDHKSGGFGLKAVENIFIVDQDTTALSQISSTILTAGYKVATANSGTKAIERMMVDVPDVALINLNLTDISGDLVIHRLNRLTRTQDVMFILYVNRVDGKHDEKVLENFSKKSQVLACIEYSDSVELLNSIEHFKMKVNKSFQ